MIEPASSSPPPAARDWALPTLVGIVIVYAILNSAMLASDETSEEAPFLGFTMLGAAIVQPILFGAWTALASGSVLMRMLFVAPCLMVPLIVPLYVAIPQSERLRKDSIAIALATFAIYLTSVAVFSILRINRFRLRRGSLTDTKGQFQFGIKHLLALMTIYGVMLGLTCGLTFRHPPDSPQFFGPNFVFYIAFFGGGFFSGAALPTVAIPVFILHGRPTVNAILSAVLFWVFTTITLALLVFGVEGGESFTPVAAAQIGALFTGTLTALALRYTGLRLVRRHSSDSPLSAANSPSPSP